MLPYLAAEQDNDALIERVIALTVAGIEDMPESILVRLLPFTIHRKQVRKAAFTRFKKFPPSKKCPRWLQEHWKIVLKPEKSSERGGLCLNPKKTEVPITKALMHLELDESTPFAEALISRGLNSVPMISNIYLLKKA